MSRRRLLSPYSQPVVTAATPIVDLPPIWGSEPPASISTLAYGDSAGEVFLMIATARRVFPDVPILVYCEPGLFDRFRKTGLPSRGLKFCPFLSDFEMRRREPSVARFDSDGPWSPTVLTFKMDAVSAAVRRFGSTLFVDSDVLFMQPFGVPRSEPIVGLSPHFSGDLAWERKVGQVNAGLVYVNHPRFGDWWRREFRHRSTFFEQQCLETAHAEFPVAIFGPVHNVGIWADPSRWEVATTLHVHLYRPRRAIHKVFHVERAAQLAKFAECRLRQWGFGPLIADLNRGSF